MKATLPRTAAFSWSPSSLLASEPLLATGTVAGALDASFSNDSLLEIWSPSYSSTGAVDAQLKPKASAVASARFNRLAWGHAGGAKPYGFLAAGLESGELAIWDADTLLNGGADAQILKNTTHTGPIKGLHFNPIQSNLLASGGVNGEIFIWDLTNPTKPYSPGARSSKLDEITAAAWNSQVAHILATSSASGFTVVWDLKNKREVTALAYGGGAATSGGLPGAAGQQGRRGVGSVCWHPDTPTRLVTASDDDSSPIIMLWDLRNARAPEKILTGHDKGILGMSWCKQDSDLLLSCGKDNRTLAWNPQTAEIVGELPPSNNWSFDVQWCPRNPSLLATASFDGTVGIHSLQANNLEASINEPQTSAAPPPADGSDVFGLPSASDAALGGRGLTLRQAPKWLRRPASATFGFGGQLVSISNLPSATGGTQSSVVHLRDVVTEPGIVARASRLQDALEAEGGLAAFCDERSKDPTTRPDDVANWKALQTLFTTGSRDELVALLGFSKEDVAQKVGAAINAYKRTSVHPGKGDLPSVSFASAETEAGAAVDAPVPSTAATAPSETTTAPSEADDVSEAAKLSSGETAPTEQTEVSLFGDDNVGPGTPGAAAGADFFNNLGAGTAPRSALPEHLLASGSAVPSASSVAATAGSPGPSSVASEPLGAPRPTFRIYPAEEGEGERLITRALVLGDFESAVSLCLSSDRFADALLLAARGGPDLLARTQKTYFERRTTQLPYLRLFQSIVSDDLTDVVQNADLADWQEIFVVLCTFAKGEEFGNLAEQLGQRLEFQYTRSRTKALRKNAILCYLAAGKLEKVAGMWIDEMKEEEAAIRAGGAGATADGSAHSAHAEALQTFIEKITVFQAAVGYVDIDLTTPTQPGADSNARVYKLASLYDRFHEYVALLADQGLLEPALKYAAQTPADYNPNGAATSSARERLLSVDQARTGGRAAAAAAAAIPTTSQGNSSAYSNGVVGGANAYAASPAYAAPAVNSYSAAPATNNYAAPASANYDAYGPSVGAQSDPYGAPAPYGAYNAQAPSVGVQNAYGAYGQNNSAYGAAQPLVPPPPPFVDAGASQQGSAPGVNIPPPPFAGNFGTAAAPPPPPKRVTAEGGWNDAPVVAARRGTPSVQGKVSAPITSPFPNSPAPSYGAPQQGGALPPPPRGATPGAGGPPPGPGRGAFSPPPRGGPPGQARPPPAGPPRAGSAAGTRGPAPPSGAYAPAPGAVNAPPPPMPGQGGPLQPGLNPQQQQQQRGFPGQQLPAQGGQYGAPPGARPPPPSQGGPQGGPLMPPGGVPPRAHTPGAGAGAPLRSQTPAKPATKYPPGDRSHIPDAQKPVFNVLSRELARVRATAPPAQKRMVDDAERRLNLLFDHLNCGTVDARLLPILSQLIQAIDARNQPAALSLHLEAASMATGELGAAMVGVKLLISRLNA
ncbi:wd40 repeat-like protein [Ceraceosorus bombacis]|uniref:Protein transport protein SEC31 n=1 Tax=Ceraceosorus bombacis TaxID=401625 RepID=A0A0P1BG18_9BASI|nr:wd40 repeat-like protein [Ceraceosorus bombacis]